MHRARLRRAKGPNGAVRAHHRAAADARSVLCRRRRQEPAEAASPGRRRRSAWPTSSTTSSGSSTWRNAHSHDRPRRFRPPQVPCVLGQKWPSVLPHPPPVGCVQAGIDRTVQLFVRIIERQQTLDPISQGDAGRGGIARATIKIGMANIAYNPWTPPAARCSGAVGGIGCADLSGLSMER